jgi:hypothetical protein
MQGVTKRALKLYFKCYRVANVTKTFTLKGVQTIHLGVCKMYLRLLRTSVYYVTFPVSFIYCVSQRSWSILGLTSAYVSTNKRWPICKRTFNKL